MISIIPGFESLPFRQTEADELLSLVQADFPNFSLDSDYLDLIQKIGGGRPLERFIATSLGTFSIDEFLHFGDNTETSDRNIQTSNINVTWSAIEDRLPIGVIPFAADPGGNYFCLDHRHDGPARVAIWQHELSDNKQHGLSEIAPTFKDFVGHLASTRAV